MHTFQGRTFSVLLFSFRVYVVISVATDDGRKLKFNKVSTESVAVMVEFEDWYSDIMKQQACVLFKVTSVTWLYGLDRLVQIFRSFLLPPIRTHGAAFYKNASLIFRNASTLNLTHAAPLSPPPFHPLYTPILFARLYSTLPFVPQKTSARCTSIHRTFGRCQ
jgi:hypothetical protein